MAQKQKYFTVDNRVPDCVAHERITGVEDKGAVKLAGYSLNECGLRCGVG